MTYREDDVNDLSKKQLKHALDKAIKIFMRELNCDYKTAYIYIIEESL